LAKRKKTMLLQSKRVWIGGQFFPAQLDVAGGKIVAVRAPDSARPDRDYGDLRLIPGLIDTHTHGAYGVDTNETDGLGLISWIAKAPAEGITALLPTTLTQSEEVLTRAVQNVATVMAEHPAGAEILGIHLEGPYLNQTYRGAHPPQYIRNPSKEQFERLQTAADGKIRLITIAPEVDEDCAFIRYAVSRGVTVNLGHTAATYEEALLAMANGASGVTHTHNAMSPYSHKSPGMLNAALRASGIFCEIIPDGIHVPFPLLGSFFAAKGAGYGVAITDSLPLKGGDASFYCFGGQQLSVRENGGAVLAGTDILAGSTLSFADGLRNLVEKALIPFGAALNACTINPARHIGADDRKGCLRAGYDADIVVLDDEYHVLQTYCRGVACL
jgi:N-acetylglucosamine-6-phosphate deacetylase